MENRKKLSNSISTLLLTVLMLLGVTLAWFLSNNATFSNEMNFAARALNVDVNITGENGKVVKKIDENGNALLVASYIKPGDSIQYNVNIKNNGSSKCKVYAGIDKVKDYSVVKGMELPETVNPISKYIRVALCGGAENGSVEYDAKYLDGLNSFYFDRVVTLEPGAELNYIYKVQFVGSKIADGKEVISGELPGNVYADKKMTAAFVVTSTLAN